MSRSLLRRATGGSRVRPASKPTGPFALDWEIGDAFPDDVIDLTPQGRSQSAPSQPRRPPLFPAAGNGRSPGKDAASRSVTSPANDFRGTQADARLATLITALDGALDHWWSDNELLPSPLLRDALLALEAGHDLDEGHRTLVLRSALGRRKGVLTALRYQTDPERTAFLLKEALLDVWRPLAPDLLWRLKRDDPGSATWSPSLIHELRDELKLVEGVQHELAARSLAALTGELAPVTPRQMGLLLRPLVAADQQTSRRRYWSPGRALLALVAALALVVLGRQVRGLAPAAMISIPGGDYLIGVGSAGEEAHIVSLAPFALDQNEVTIRNYRQCMAVGVCPAPRSSASLTRTDYFTNPIFDQYPVVHVPLAAAEQFCGWLGKRLPSADEWEVAAGFSPATGRHTRYPWGDLYDRQVANASEAGLGDTRPVGSFQPQGNTPTDLTDMAGNVAEWTATPDSDGLGAMIIKGGSYRDGAQAVLVSAEAALAPDEATPWLGFRCAADQPS